MGGRRGLAGRDGAAGRAGAPWPPHYEKQTGEPPRVQPSKRRSGSSSGGPGTGRRQSTMPLIEIARAETKDEAMAGLERWKAWHPEVWPRLATSDVPGDAMR